MKRLIIYFLSVALCAGAYAQVANPPQEGSVSNQKKALRYAQERKPALTERQKSMLDRSVMQKQEESRTFMPVASVLSRQGSPAESQPKLVLKEVRPVEGNMARITLDVQIDWGDGTGYQLLLDPDCRLYNELGETSYEEIYDEADYKIPADAAYLSSSLTVGQQGSTDIPGGMYDFIVFNPVPTGDGEGYTYTANGLGAGDDIQFESGHEYVFTIKKTGSTDNCAITSDSPVNLSIVSIKSPRSSAGFTSAENVIVTFANNGTDAISSFTASYTINGGTPVTETVNHTLQPGESFDYTFAAKADLTSGSPFTIKVTAETEGDVIWADNVATVTVEDLSPLPAPYTCSFDNADDINEWDIINANNDSQTWSFNTEKGYAQIIYSAYEASDDYLVTARPIALEAGTNNVVLNYNAKGGSYQERMELLYGTTPYVEDMTVIGSFIDFVQASEPINATINIPDMAAGNYYFALHAISAPNKFGIEVYDITISNGIYAGSPDIVVDRVLLPYSSCSLTSDESISAVLTNIGQGTAAGFTLNCRINGEEAISQMFDIEVAPKDTVTVTFGIPADLSATGVYTVEVTATDIIPADGMLEETVTDNNTAESSVTHFTPADVPFAVDFSDTEDSSQWTSDGSWEINPNSGTINCVGTTPLISRGLNLKGGKTYKMSYNYIAGLNYLFLTAYETYSVICGRDGEDPATWETVATFEDVYTNEEYADNKVYFSVPEDGVYSLGFVESDPQGTLSLRTIEISEATQYDVALRNISGLPTMLPKDLAGSMILSVPVTNRGSETVSGEITATIGDTTIGTARFNNLTADETWTIDVKAALPTDKLGTNDIDIVATIDGHDDETPEDNATAASINVTEDVYAYDHVTENMYLPYYAAGADGQQTTIGIVFNVYTQTILKAISVGWGIVDGQEITLHVFKWNPLTMADSYGYLHIDEELYSSTTSQGEETGQIEYILNEPLQLSKGYYMLAVSYTDPELVVDNVTPGQLYMISNNNAGEWIASDMSGTQFGTPAIRAILGNTSTSVTSAETAGTALSLYPNPVSTTLNITCGGAELKSVSIYSTSGAVVCSETACGSEFSYDVSALTPGIYFAKVATANGTEVKKFIVK